ncbi:hypothetical protein [Streptomyces sp. NPDC089799]|uniref:hypothetical protein n=1 Tax=Streptomyces sp. NPDC089799 TaxID=3155066 RepID=UPI003440E2AE
MPFDWTGVTPAVGAAAAVVAALVNLYRDRRSRTAALPAPDGDPVAVLPPVAGEGPVAVRIEVSGTSGVRVAVAGRTGPVLVEVLVAPSSGPSGPSAKERAPW